jgi:hypothetical protein
MWKKSPMISGGNGGIPAYSALGPPVDPCRLVIFAI